MRLVNCANNEEIYALNYNGKVDLDTVLEYFDTITYYTRALDLDPNNYGGPDDEQFAVISQIFKEDETAEMILVDAYFMKYLDDRYYDKDEDGSEHFDAEAYVEKLRKEQFFQAFTADEMKNGTDRDIYFISLDLRFRE